VEQSILLQGLLGDVAAALGPTIEELALRRVVEPAQRPALALVALDGDVPGAMRLVHALASTGTRVAVAAARKDADLILLAMRAGAREFVVSSDRAAMDAAIRTLARPDLAPAAASITAVFGAKGGMGATAIASNVAGVLAAREERVCLLDLDLELGDVLAILDLAAGYAITDVIDNIHRLDRNLLDSSVVRHRSGVAVLSRGERIEEASRVEPEKIAKLLSFLREHYAHVIVDGLHGFGDLALAALDASDTVLLLVTQEVAAVRSAQRCFEIFRRLGYPDSKVKLVVNRFQKSSRISKAVIEETIGVSVAATIANDFALLSRAVNHGGLVAEEGARSAIARDLQALATVLDRNAETPSHRGSILGRLFSARGARANGTH
jgi:pilus assembly protein CpaE